jgi:hypothetical protein
MTSGGVSGVIGGEMHPATMTAKKQRIDPRMCRKDILTIHPSDFIVAREG